MDKLASILQFAESALPRGGDELLEVAAADAGVDYESVLALGDRVAERRLAAPGLRAAAPSRSGAVPEPPDAVRRFSDLAAERFSRVTARVPLPRRPRGV